MRRHNRSSWNMKDRISGNAMKNRWQLPLLPSLMITQHICLTTISNYLDLLELDLIFCDLIKQICLQERYITSSKTFAKLWEENSRNFKIIYRNYMGEKIRAIEILAPQEIMLFTFIDVSIISSFFKLILYLFLFLLVSLLKYAVCEKLWKNRHAL